jgi:hypothetical protein
MVNNVIIREFPEGFSSKDSAVVSQRDTVLSNPKIEADTIQISLTQIALVPKLKLEKNVPQWGFVLDSSSGTQKTFPCLVMVIGRLSDGPIRQMQIEANKLTLSVFYNNRTPEPIYKRGPGFDHWTTQKD